MAVWLDVAAADVGGFFVFVSKSLFPVLFVHTIIDIEISFDPDKNARNIAERGLPFERVTEFDFETAFYETDNRRDYGEARIRAFGFLDGRLHVLVFVETASGIRVISLRRANKREVRRYEQATQP